MNQVSTRIHSAAEGLRVRQGATQPPAAVKPNPIDASDTFERVAGKGFGVLGAVLAPLPSAISGGLQGVRHNMTSEHLGTLQNLNALATATVAGTALGAVIGGPVGAAVGAGVCSLLGSLQTVVLHLSGGCKEIGEAIRTDVNTVIADNEPTGNPVRDASRDFTEGALTGLHTGNKAGYAVGFEQGSGIASGLVEGIKGVRDVFGGAWDPDTDPSQSGSRDDKPVGLFRKAVELAAGSVGAVVGSVVVTADGAAQGLTEGARHNYDGSVHLHRRMVAGSMAVVGAAVGTAVFGPLGGVLGAGAGYAAGRIANLLEKETGTDQAVVDAVSLAVGGAAGDNTKAHSLVYRAFRDSVEGAMVGSAAGMRSGFTEGYAGGASLADGVLDGLSDIWHGIIDGVGQHTPPNGQGPAPQPAPPNQP